MTGTQAPAADDGLLTPKRVGDLLAVEHRVVRRWVRTGLLRCTRDERGHIRLYRADVEALLSAAGIDIGALERGDDELMAPGRVIRVLRAPHQTLRDWAEAGQLTFVQLPSGARRYLRSSVEELRRRKGWGR